MGTGGEDATKFFADLRHRGIVKFRGRNFSKGGNDVIPVVLGCDTIVVKDQK